MVTNKLITSILLLVINITSVWASPENRAVFDYSFTSDTDNTEFQNYLVGYDRLFSGKQFIGVLVGERKYHGEDATPRNNNFNELKFAGRKDFSNDTHIKGSVSILDGKSWDPELYTLVLSHNATPAWHVEAGTDKEVIETASAIAKQLTINTYSLTNEYVFNDQHSLAVILYKQSVSDSNSRTGSVIQYKHNPDWAKDFYIKLRAKQRSSDFNPAEYFSPGDFRQYHVLLGYVKPIEPEQNLVFKAEVGVGKQYIDDIGENANEYLVGLRGWLHDSIYMDSYYGCTSDGGTDNYEYCYGRITFNYLW